MISVEFVLIKVNVKVYFCVCVCDLRMKEGKGLTSGWDSVYVCVCVI